MMGKWVLVVCFQVVLWVPTQSTETSELCDSDGFDGSAYLQSHLKASSALQVAGAANASKRLSCDVTQDGSKVDTINTGICETTSSVTACVGCEGGGTIPSGGAGFPTGSLLCLNEQAGSGQVCEADTTPFAFQDSNDFMTCRGYQSCVNSWFVTNVGAVCCSVANGGESCKGRAEFTMTTDEESSCTSDACCDGEQTCDQASFTGVNSMSCRGLNACQASTFSLDRDLYCSSTSIVMNGVFNNVCDDSTFTFKEGGDHCVQCLGDNVCTSSNTEFTFELASQVSMNCVGGTTCNAATIRLADSSKLRLVCDGSDTCQDSIVNLGGSNSEMLLTCLNSACDPMTINRNGGDCQCTADSDTCPSDCECQVAGCEVSVPSVCSRDDPDTACCSGNGENADEGGHPDCAQCGCGVSTTTSTTSTGGGGGDPHIDTFDGQHYLLLKQGSFSFWHFSGSDAEVMSAKWLKKLPVDFKMYAHYSGHLSYTKGILLLDSSGMQQPRQMLELTSEDCLWRASQPGMAGARAASWRTIDKPQLLSVPDRDGDEFTAFRFSPSSKGQKMDLGLLMKQRDGAWKSVGTLFVRCKPGYHINMKMAMSSKKEMDRVDGQIASHGHTSAGDDHSLPTASFLHFMNQRVRNDQEFLTPKSWSDLGGSKQAAEYLGDVDEEGPAFLKGCSEKERLEASNTCKKYLGQAPVGAGLLSFETSLRNCVFDVCNGGGEVAAELAAEILYAE